MLGLQPVSCSVGSLGKEWSPHEDLDHTCCAAREDSRKSDLSKRTQVPILAWGGGPVRLVTRSLWSAPHNVLIKLSGWSTGPGSWVLVPSQVSSWTRKESSLLENFKNVFLMTDRPLSFTMKIKLLCLRGPPVSAQSLSALGLLEGEPRAQALPPHGTRVASRACVRQSPCVPSLSPIGPKLSSETCLGEASILQVSFKV